MTEQGGYQQLPSMAINTTTTLDLWSYSTGPCESTTFWPLWWGTQAVIKFVMQTANSFPNNTCSCPKGCTMNCWRKIQTQKYQPYCFNQIRTDLNNYKAGFIKFQAIVHILMRFQSPFAKILGAQAGKLSSKFKQRWNFQSDGTTPYPKTSSETWVGVGRKGMKMWLMAYSCFNHIGDTFHSAKHFGTIEKEANADVLS